MNGLAVDDPRKIPSETHTQITGITFLVKNDPPNLPYTIVTKTYTGFNIKIYINGMIV